MSADKRKRHPRAMEFLRQINWRYTSDGKVGLNGDGKWSLKNPIIRYVIERGFATIRRVPAHGSYRGDVRNRRTLLDTGLASNVTPWKARTLSPAERPDVEKIGEGQS